MASPSLSTNVFQQFDLPRPVLEALTAMGFNEPTPVQAEAIPSILAGRDLIARAQTGSGKTAAFVVPLLARLLCGSSRPVLVLAPTRELAEQILTVVRDLTIACPEHKATVVIGGVGYQDQLKALKAHPAFVIGTPGRLIDHVESGVLRLGEFGTLVLDEADRLLDMGFGPQIETLVAKMSKERQTLLFSATFPPGIEKIAARYLRKPRRIDVEGASLPIPSIRETVIETSGDDEKSERLISEIDKIAGSIIVFARTVGRVERVARLLAKAGHRVDRIHGGRSQTQRGKAIAALRDESIRILVATDIAARGLDVPHIAHVINYDLPLNAEDYIHRMGRSGRAGRDGHAIAFVARDEEALWRRIRELMSGKEVSRPLGPATVMSENGALRKGASRKRTSPSPKDAGASSGERSTQPRRTKPLARVSEPRRGRTGVKFTRDGSGGVKEVLTGIPSRVPSKPPKKRRR